MSAHRIHPTRAPRAHRDAIPAYMPRHASRGAWHAHADHADSAAPGFASAQTVFYVARGLAVLLAAVAVGLSAASDETEPLPATPATASHATAR